MTTDTLDEIYEQPTLYDLEGQSVADKDPFDKEKGKKNITFLRIAVILLIVVIVVLPQIAPLDGKVVQGNFVMENACRISFRCHVESTDNLSTCVCPPLLAKSNPTE